MRPVTRLADFDYDLPSGYIAQYPLRKRAEARMMVINRATRRIYHDIFLHIADYLPKNSSIVLNNSKVIPARLRGTKEGTGARIEVFLLNKLSDGYSYEALVRPARRLQPHDKIIFNGSGIHAHLEDKKRRIVRFSKKNVSHYLDRIGHIPLPPYIKRYDTVRDRIYYQTVYAQRAGSVASPTAGLHFTQSLLKHLKKRGHSMKMVTLHINYATFKPVEEHDIRDHTMHRESYAVSRPTFHALMRETTNGKKVVAVGTTSCRVLETIAHTGKYAGDTDLFIYPGYAFRMVDALVTNFHLPRSTLLMLVSAFGGHDLIMRAYRIAIQKRYRFYSYGDCMLII